MRTDAEQVAKIIAQAREEYGENADITDDAEVTQEQSGCWVAARVWVENVYIETED